MDLEFISNLWNISDISALGLLRITHFLKFKIQVVIRQLRQIFDLSNS